MRDIDQIYEYLDKAGTYYLATVSEGKPRIRPFSTVLIYEDHLYILTGNKKRVYQELLAQPQVDLAVMAKDQKTWIHISGTVREDNRQEPLLKMAEKYPDFVGKYNQSADAENAVFYFESGKATIASWCTKPIELSL